MGVLDALKKKEKTTAEDLEKARQEVTKSKEEQGKTPANKESDNLNDDEKRPAGPGPKTKKTVSLENYKNINNTANSEMRIIKILNEIDTLKAKMDENTSKILKEVKNVDTDVDSLGDLVANVPKQTMEELANIKKNQPAMYYKLKELISEKVRASVVDMIDANILKIIKKAGKITSHDLLAKAEAMHACSKNTLYGHLKDLHEKGLVTKRRDGHEVIYSVSEAAAKAMDEAAPEQDEDSAKQDQAPAKAQQPGNALHGKTAKEPEPSKKQKQPDPAAAQPKTSQASENLKKVANALQKPAAPPGSAKQEKPATPKKTAPADARQKPKQAAKK